MRTGTPAIVDALEAVVATEQSCARALWMPQIPAHLVGENVFGEKAEQLGSDLEDGRGALEACEQAAARRDRVAALLSARALADARRSLVRLAEKRRAVVVHVLVSPRGTEPTVSGYADLYAVADVGVGVVFARDAQDAADLTVIAHRAAEDAEAPVLVVHDGFPSSYARERIVLPNAELLRAALEPAPPALSGVTEDLVPAHRRAATRIPFALASAMRAFDRHSRRKMDAIELAHVNDAELVLLAAGSIGETARALVEHLRAATPSMAIGMLQLTTFRPFPGAQIVKALARVRAIAVIERLDAPLVQSSPLALEVKAAFADALTWAPGYPGIGRIPNVYSGCVEPDASEATPGDIMAIVENVFQGELGRRIYHIGARHPHEHAIASAEERPVNAAGAFTVRWSSDPSLVLQILATLHGGFARATPRLVGKTGEAFDVTVSRAPVRAHHGASELDLIVLSGIEAHDLDALDELREGGFVLTASSDRTLAEVTPSVRNAIRARQARVMVTPKESSALGSVAASIAGIERSRPSAAKDTMQSDVERSLRAASPPLGETDVRLFLDALARALASTICGRPRIDVSVLSARDLAVSYDGRPSSGVPKGRPSSGVPKGRQVLRDVKLELAAGDLVVVLGPNGAGKTTLLRALAGTLAPTRGTVSFEGRDLATMARDEIARTIAVVPQEIPLAEGFSVREVVAMGRAPHQGRWLRASPEDHAIVEESLARCEVEALAERPFAELSGGERKRVVVAQALAQRPRVLLLDEPSAFLDIEHAVALFELVRAETERGTSVLAISHDLALAARFARRVALLSEGRLSDPGPADEVLHPDRLREVFHVEVERFLDADGRPRAFAAQKKHVVG